MVHISSHVQWHALGCGLRIYRPGYFPAPYRYTWYARPSRYDTIRYDTLYLRAPKSWRIASLICRTEPVNKKSNGIKTKNNKKASIHWQDSAPPISGYWPTSERTQASDAKHVSSVIFYHLSNRYLPNVMKISAKINNINILLFVRLLSLTNWRNA